MNEDLVVVMLDAEKAFDKVWHEGLFRKLAQLDIPTPIWKIMRDWYIGFRSQVRWNHQLSRPISIKQGTLQGSGAGPDLFKEDIDDTLHDVTSRNLGAKIGTICCSVPACVDDISVACRPDETQTIVSIIGNRGNKDQRVFNSNKSFIMPYPAKKKKPINLPEVTLNGIPLVLEKETTHLGILQGPAKDINTTRVDNQIQCATNALYALFGAGMHGRAGLNPVISRKLWIIFILPRLLYGTELWVLSKPLLQKLEHFQRVKLRQIQDLPPNTANCVTIGLIGVLPIEAEIDKRVLSLFRNLAANQGSVEANIALRQLATKETSSNSWFIHVKNILEKYNLPPAHVILHTPPTKPQWKRQITSAIGVHWTNELHKQLNNLSSTRYIAEQSVILTRPAPVWECSMGSRRESHKARTKARLMCGVYRLQTHEAMQKQNQYSVSPVCLMCSSQPETREHFLLVCSALAITRNPFLIKLDNLLMSVQNVTMVDRNITLQLILDPWHHSLPEWTKIKTLQESIEKIARDMIYELHIKRCMLIEQVPARSRGKSKR
jgi:hypothetical protein